MKTIRQIKTKFQNFLWTAIAEFPDFLKQIYTGGDAR